MPLLLLAAFLAVPLAEVFLFIELGGAIGALWTVLLCVATAAAGAAVVRVQGRAVAASARETLRAGRMPAVEAFDGVCLLVAGLMLLTPGFFTDATGFLLLVPLLRHGLRRMLARHVRAAGPRTRAGPGGAAMDGEWTVVDDPPPPPGDRRLGGPRP